MEHTGEDPLMELRKAIVAQKTAALPDRPADPALQELHQKIVDYDRHVSESVIAILGGGRTVTPYPAASEIDPLLNQKLAGAAGPSRSMLMLYQRYKERLDRMFSLAARVAQTRQTE